MIDGLAHYAEKLGDTQHKVKSRGRLNATPLVVEGQGRKPSRNRSTSRRKVVFVFLLFHCKSQDWADSGLCNFNSILNFDSWQISSFSQIDDIDSLKLINHTV